MTSPKRFFLNNSFYHIYSRGVEKRDIFLEKADYLRFLNTLRYYQQAENHGRFSDQDLNQIEFGTKRNLEIVNYCLMPNHFHLLLFQSQEKGISRSMSLTLNSYSRYFNTKYQRVGPLFQSRFQMVPVCSDEQLLHLTRYILLNPYVDHLSENLEEYEWSGYKEYFFKQSKTEICSMQDRLSSYFDNNASFQKFIHDHADFARSRKDMQKLFLD